jgi:uncharacterized protein (TIGR00251 family)
MIELLPHAEGVVVAVRAQPGARANAIRGVQDGALKVAVTQVAEKGKANRAILAVLCDALHLKKSQVEIVSGDLVAQKKVLVRGVTPTELLARLQPLVSLQTGKNP